MKRIVINRYILVVLTAAIFFGLTPTNTDAQVNGTNVARGKTATQSSTGFGGPANRAVDGNTSGAWGNRSVTHTNLDNQPWWQVDLGAAYDISEIKIFNRTDCCKERLNQFRIIYSDRPITSNQGNIFANFQPASASNPRSFRNNVKNARYVRIFINGRQYLHLAEVQIF